MQTGKFYAAPYVCWAVSALQCNVGLSCFLSMSASHVKGSVAERSKALV